MSRHYLVAHLPVFYYSVGLHYCNKKWHQPPPYYLTVPVPLFHALSLMNQYRSLLVSRLVAIMNYVRHMLELMSIDLSILLAK